MAKGCYLTFSEASQGTLFLHWFVTVQINFAAQRHIFRESSVDSRRLVVYAHRSEAPVAGALAFFEPRKTVPAFKYKSNGGRSELIREMSGGTGERIKRFYTGLCQFVKLAKSFDAALVFYEHGTLPSVEIALIDGSKSDYNVVRVATNAPVESLASVTAVGVAPGASDAFAASTFSREYFISTATKAGSALTI